MNSLTGKWVGYVCIISFIMAYSLVVFEEKIHLRKSKPVVLIGCLMWMLIGIYEASHGGNHHAEEHVKHLIEEIGALFFFLLVLTLLFAFLVAARAALSIRRASASAYPCTAREASARARAPRHAARSADTTRGR